MDGLLDEHELPTDAGVGEHLDEVLVAVVDRPVGAELRFQRLPDGTTDLDAVVGAYPIDIDGDGHVDLAVLRIGGVDVVTSVYLFHELPRNAVTTVDYVRGIVDDDYLRGSNSRRARHRSAARAEQDQASSFRLLLADDRGPRCVYQQSRVYCNELSAIHLDSPSPVQWLGSSLRTMAVGSATNVQQ